MKGNTAKGLFQKIAMVVLVVAGVVVLICGLSQPTAKAQEGGSSPASGCECDCEDCYTCDTNCNCVHVADKCCGVKCDNPCAPNCVDGVCQPKCTNPCYPTCSNGNCLAPACSASWCEDVPEALACGTAQNVKVCIGGGVGGLCVCCYDAGFVPQQPTVCSNAAGNSTPCQAVSVPCSVKYTHPGRCEKGTDGIVVGCFPDDTSEEHGLEPCTTAAQCS